MPSPSQGRRRHRLTSVLLILLVSAMGIGSRRFGDALPGFLAAYAGDTLWAVAAFLAIGALLPRASTWIVAVLALALSAAVELSQLYHAPWIDSIRGTTVGGLLLGFSFVWTDLACYAVGVGLASLFEVAGRYTRRFGSSRRG